MEQEEDLKTAVKKPADVNGNNAQFNKVPKKRSNGAAAGIKDHVVLNDGRVLYPCQFCNKVFHVKRSRVLHITKCPAKAYILSVDDKPVISNGQTTQKPDIPPPKKPPSKIDIQQNIVLNTQMDVSEILSKSKSPPIKITIRRTVNNGTDKEHFTVSNSLILKEKNEPNDDFLAIAKRLENNAVTIIKQPRPAPLASPIPEPPLPKGAFPEDVCVEDPLVEEPRVEDASESPETSCRECTNDAQSPIELLRHSRKCHSYPRVLMALSEVKKFYAVTDRSQCPICQKPLKTNFRSAFVKHLHTHTNEMKYSCTVCNKKFRRLDHMKAHAKRHVLKDEK